MPTTEECHEYRAEDKKAREVSELADHFRRRVPFSNKLTLEEWESIAAIVHEEFTES